jgi:hypothetical protein
MGETKKFWVETECKKSGVPSGWGCAGLHGKNHFLYTDVDFSCEVSPADGITYPIDDRLMRIREGVLKPHPHKRLWKPTEHIALWILRGDNLIVYQKESDARRVGTWRDFKTGNPWSGGFS